MHPINIPAPNAATVVARPVCPKCGQPTRFCPHCGGRFCDNPACDQRDLYHREECRDTNRMGD